jgi:hypothetical protein
MKSKDNIFTSDELAVLIELVDNEKTIAEYDIESAEEEHEAENASDYISTLLMLKFKLQKLKE